MSDPGPDASLGVDGPLDAVVLAGGLGTRLRSVVSDVPKPMAPVAGRPFVEHQLDWWLPQGVTRVLFSVGYKHEVVSGHFGSEHRGVPVEYVVEDEPLGTGGGLLLAEARGDLTDPYLVLNGDTFFRVQLGPMRARHARTSPALSMALVEVEDSERYTGVGVEGEDRVTSLRERGEGASRTLINGGVYLIRAGALSGLGHEAGARVSLEDELFPRLLEAEGGIRGHVATGDFLDIGVPEAYARAAEVVLGEA